MSFLDSVFGKKPDVPGLEKTDPLVELSRLLGGEIKSWPEIEQLSNLYQDYMLGALDKAIPGFSDILRGGSENTIATQKAAQSYLGGELPPELVSQIFRTGAAQNLQSGLLGSPAGSANQLRNYGVGLMEGQKFGADLATSAGNAAQRWAGIASGTIMQPKLYDPAWFSEFMAKERASQQAIKQQRANVAAAPNPALQALNQWIEQVGGSIVSSYAGGGMGKGGDFKTSFNTGQYGINPQQNQGFNWTGYNDSSGMSGGLNIGPWTLGGQPMPYMGGSDVSTPGYYMGGSNPSMMSPFNAWNPDPAMYGGAF